MPTLEIDDDIHALIRELANNADESDTAVLRRVLESARADRAAALKAYEQSEQDITSTN